MSIAFGAFVTSVTQDKIVPKCVDNSLSGNVLLERLLRNAKPWSGGHEIYQPIRYTTKGIASSYSGFDTLSTSQVNTRVSARFRLSQSYNNVVIGNHQLAVNMGDEKVLDLVAVEMSTAADELADDLGTQLFADGTGNNSKDLVGLDAAVDDGNTTGTYANLLRSTYTTWVSNLDSSSNAITLAELRASFDAAKIGNDAPTLIVMHPSEWTTFEGLLTATINYHTQVQGYPKISAFTSGRATGQQGDIGYDSLFFRGTPVVADEKETDGTIHLLNERHMFLAVKKHPEYPIVKIRSLPGRENEGFSGFAWSGFKTPTNQDAKVGQIFWYGQLIVDSCRHHAYLTGKS